MQTVPGTSWRLSAHVFVVFALGLCLPSTGSTVQSAVQSTAESTVAADPAGTAKSRFGSGSLPDFSGIADSAERKLRFFSFLLPLVQEENRWLDVARRRLEYIHDHIRFERPIPPADRVWLDRIAAEFGLEGYDPRDPVFWCRVRRRVDIVPEDLVLVQAAMESAWGTSRFARQGCNLFGQWCTSPGCGIVPADRPAGQEHEVARFATVNASIASYLRNLNTGRSYRKLRRIREKMREQGLEPDAARMAGGLTPYAQRGAHYVQTIRAMLRHNADVIEEARRGCGSVAAARPLLEGDGG